MTPDNYKNPTCEKPWINKTKPVEIHKKPECEKKHITLDGKKKRP